jgi:predicted component of type VI protein secretion system
MTEKLKKILEENNLQECIPIFEQQKLLDVETVSDLTESDLEKIGISSLGDRKKILRLFSRPAQVNTSPSPVLNPSPSPAKPKEQPQNPQEVVIHHAAMKGNDVSTGLGRGFGEAVGKEAGGCAWKVITTIVVIIVIIVIIVVMNG